MTGLNQLDRQLVAGTLNPDVRFAWPRRLFGSAQRQQAEFIIATHSPILVAYPESTIYEFTREGVAQVDYRDTEHCGVMPDIMANPRSGWQWRAAGSGVALGSSTAGVTSRVQIHMLLACSKTERDDLTEAQLRALRDLVRQEFK